MSDLWHALQTLLHARNRGVLKPNDRAMIECLVLMLTLEAQYPTYIIMDAICECPFSSSVPSPREEVLELVDELVRAHLSNLHVCVTSRPELDIQTALRPLTPHLISHCKWGIACDLGAVHSGPRDTDLTADNSTRQRPCTPSPPRPSSSPLLAPLLPFSSIAVQVPARLTSSCC